MDDRTLLEKAAKVAGIRIEWVRPFVAVGDFAIVPHNAETGDCWDPLCDDGDALRLAVKLGIVVKFDRNAPPEQGLPGECAIAVYDAGRATQWIAEAPQRGDEYAATRRAIVRAAAAMADKGE